MGSGEKDKRRISYGESGERWVEKAEAKVFAKRERYKKRLITKPLRRAYGKFFTFSGNHRDEPRTLVFLCPHTYLYYINHLFLLY